MFDREARREKIIEAKQRELKLKTKSLGTADINTKKNKNLKLIDDENRLIHEMEHEFKQLIESLVSHRDTLFCILF